MTVWVRAGSRYGSVIRAWLVLLAMALLVMLAGCDSSSSRSSSGGGAVENSPFAGDYQGTMRTTVMFGNQSLTEDIPVTVRVATNGRVEFLVDDRTGCRQVDPVFLDGNSFSYSARYSCQYDGVGTCDVRENGNGTISGAALNGQLAGTVSCGVGSAGLQGSLSATKSG